MLAIYVWCFATGWLSAEVSKRLKLSTADSIVTLLGVAAFNSIAAHFLERAW